MLITFPFIILSSLIANRISYFFIRLWAAGFSLLCGIPVSIRNKPKLKEATGYMYISNHTSFLDAVALVQAIPGAIKPLGKVELLRIPIMGWVIGRFAVIVDRGSKESRRESMKKLAAAVHDKDSILIFPEGTMNRTSEPLQKFYEGAFRIAREAQVPIKPIVIQNAGKLLPPSKLRLLPGKVRLTFGPPILPDQEIDDMVKQARAWMLSVLDPA